MPSQSRSAHSIPSRRNSARRFLDPWTTLKISTPSGSTIPCLAEWRATQRFDMPRRKNEEQHPGSPLQQDSQRSRQDRDQPSALRRSWRSPSASRIVTLNEPLTFHCPIPFISLNRVPGLKSFQGERF